jgi:hypothetical protein
VVKPKLLLSKDFLLSELKNQELALETNLFTKKFTLSVLYKSIDNSMTMERDQLVEQEDYEVHLNYIEAIKDKLADVHKNTKDWNELHLELKKFAANLEILPPVSCDKLTCLYRLLAIPEIKQTLNLRKEQLPKGHLLDCTLIFPDKYFKQEDSKMFMKANSAKIIRMSFGYYHTRVEDLRALGFIYSEEEKVMNFIRNNKTGEVNIIKNGSKFSPGGRKTFAPRKTGYNNQIIKYRLIVGLKREDHQKAVREFNSLFDIRQSNAHRVKHNEHIVIKKGDKRKMHKNTIMYLDKHGKQTTAKAFAELHNISVQAAHKRLKKLFLTGDIV